LSGPTLNFLVGIILYAVIFFNIGAPVPDKILIAMVAPNTPAAQAQIQEGDYIIAVNGEKLDNILELQNLIDANRGQEVDVTLLRENEPYTVSLTPRVEPPPNEGAIGIGMINPYLPVSIGGALSAGVKYAFNQVYSFLTLPGRLLGYKGIYDVYNYMRGLDAESGEEVPSGLNTLSFIASISISLGLLNLIPIPALDGGRTVFALAELFLRKRVPVVYENLINMIGLGLMLLVLIYVNLQDFINPIQLP
jgi:regulator of sigma E protease